MYPVLEIKNLSKKFNNITAVNRVNLQVEKGDTFGFLGPNGAGKTTTIRMILGLVHSDGGEIYINGIDTRKNFKKAIEKVGAIVETPRFYPYLSAYKNLELIANLHGDIPASTIYELLELVGLKDRSKSKVKTFSLGMKQRLGIARALINDPDFVILDEPTNGLDPQGIREVRDLIRFLNAEKNITFFISTHILSEVEQICNKVAILKEGSIIDSGYVEDILSTETESLVIEIKEIGKAIDILSELSRFGIIEESINSVQIEIKKGCFDQISQELFKNNIMVDCIVKRKHSLEDYYIHITEGRLENGLTNSLPLPLKQFLIYFYFFITILAGNLNTYKEFVLGATVILAYIVFPYLIALRHFKKKDIMY